MERPGLSVIVATIHGADDIGPCLERLLPQIEALGAELIVADSSGTAFTLSHPQMRVLSRPGESVFAMRAEAAHEARGEVIACTEDHCMVDPDWCANIVAAHRQHPHGLIAGVVANGSPDLLIDWANFLLAFSPFIKPLTTHPGTRIPPLSNASYKRSYLPDALVAGDLEIAIPERLRVAGSLLVLESISVSHIQTFGFAGTMAAHFHNGRSTAGLALAGSGRRRRWRRVGVALVAAPRLVLQTARNVLRRGVPRRAKLSLPLLTLVVAAHTLGEITGAVRGPGHSPLLVD